jgi:membrane-associated protease RseP (regulator of RpoE activity)
VGSPSWPDGPRERLQGNQLESPYGYSAPTGGLPTAWERWGRNLALFVLTALSVFLMGWLPNGQVAEGLRLAAALLSILVAHEMGHYLVARRYGVDVTLPFFIPFPIPGVSLVGTLGAFIRIRSRIPHRRALFDIGVAGPLAGFVVCLPVLWLGLREAVVRPPDPESSGILLGDPLLFSLATWLVHGNVPSDHNVVIGPLGLAAWFGLLVTALNLMPIGQLDGGHVTYSLLRERAHRVSRIGSWLCVALIYFGPSWILWAILMRVFGRRRHPPTIDDEAPIGRARVWVGVLSLVVFAVCFVPDPIVFSWWDLYEATGLARFLPRP